MTVGEAGDDAVSGPRDGAACKGRQAGGIYVVDQAWRAGSTVEVRRPDWTLGLVVPGRILLQGGIGNRRHHVAPVVRSHVVDDTGDAVSWRIDDPTDPGAAVLEGSFPPSLSSPSGITVARWFALRGGRRGRCFYAGSIP